MATGNHLEAVQKVSEAVSTQNPIAQAEHMMSKEHFQTLMNTQHSALASPSFERIDAKAFAAEDTQRIENVQAFADDNVTSQKTGSATDQDNQRGRQSQPGEGVEAVGQVRSKGASSASSSSHGLMAELSGLNKNVVDPSRAGPESIKARAKEMIGQLEEAKAKLSQAEIKPAYQNVLKNRLSHIDENLKIALNKAGVEYHSPAPAESGGKNPIHKFLGYLTDGQEQLNKLNLTIDQFQGGEITPANMLAIQMKMGYVQQQIELFTNLLNKALESTKTLMNVQV